MDDAVDQGGGHLVVPEHRPHLLYSRFVVNTTDCLSYASARTWKSSLAPSASSGRNPSSSMTSRRALPMIAASRSSLPSSRARLRRITSEDAVKKRASSLLSHASAQRADAMCVLPVPTSPMSTRSSLRSTKSSASSDSRPMPSGHDTADQS